MSESNGSRPDAWWLLAGPVTGLLTGVVLGAMLGWLTTPTEGIGPFVGDHRASTIIGALLGTTIGVFAGAFLGVVLMFVVRSDQPVRTARLMAAAAALVCCPAVLLLLAVVGRVDLGRLGAVPFTTVAAAGACAAAWLAGRTPDRRAARL